MTKAKETIKYFTKDLLVKANKEAIRTKRNRSLEPDYIASLPDELKFPVCFSMVHNDVEMRVQVVFNAEGETGFLDIPFGTFDTLPEF